MSVKWGTREPGTTCKRCGDEYQLDDGCDPTKYCHHCAQSMLPRLLRIERAAAKYVRKYEAWLEANPICMAKEDREKYEAYDGLMQSLLIVRRRRPRRRGRNEY